jgi:ABC-type transport system involved in cytochrome c biogenesis permease subunit
MSLKMSIQGLLIYLTLLAYLAAFALHLARRPRAGRTLYAFGFLAALGSLAFRWVHAGHPPLQNLFEVFLCRGALVFPVTQLCRRLLPVPGERLDPLIGALLLWPAAFVFSEAPRQLPPALQSPLFVPHVTVYVLAYVLMAKAAALATASLARPDDEQGAFEVSAYRAASLGFPLLTLGLLLGATWGKLAWGDYWHWDPKEMWSLATWLVYAGYFHFRRMFPGTMSRTKAILVLAGFAAILITVSWVNLSRVFSGLHSYAR